MACSGDCGGGTKSYSGNSPLRDKTPSFVKPATKKLSDVLNNREMPGINKKVLNRSITYKKSSR